MEVRFAAAAGNGPEPFRKYFPHWLAVAVGVVVAGTLAEEVLVAGTGSRSHRSDRKDWSCARVHATAAKRSTIDTDSAVSVHGSMLLQQSRSGDHYSGDGKDGVVDVVVGAVADAAAAAGDCSDGRWLRPVRIVPRCTVFSRHPCRSDKVQNAILVPS